MTLGGVATGSMKAELQATAKAKAVTILLRPAFCEKAIIMGIMIFAEAVLDAISVKKIVARIKMSRINTGLKASESEDKCDANISASPVLKSIPPRDRPVPNKSKEPQSISDIFFE